MGQEAVSHTEGWALPNRCWLTSLERGSYDPPMYGRAPSTPYGRCRPGLLRSDVIESAHFESG